MARDVVASAVARNVMKYAREMKLHITNLLQCPDCRQFPTQPVTGYCGHTRCISCVEVNGHCFCGCVPQMPLSPTIVIQNIISRLPTPNRNQHGDADHLEASTVHGRRVRLPSILRRRLTGPPNQGRRQYYEHYPASFNAFPRRFFTIPENQFVYAQSLFDGGHYKDAAPHLAHVAVTDAPIAGRAKKMLFQCMKVLVQSNDRRTLIREMQAAMRSVSVIAWISPADMECLVCYEPLLHPVTTPCGHTFCRDCIMRSLAQFQQCAFCRAPLDSLTMVLTSCNDFLETILLALRPVRSLSQAKPESEIIPALICTVAFPTLPCPVSLTGTADITIIRRILDSGKRTFGMVTGYDDNSLALYGTMVEVRDWVQLQDGQHILSTIGITRFQILETYKDDLHIVRVAEVKDITPTVEEFERMKLDHLAETITSKAKTLLLALTTSRRSQVQEAFGPMPHFYNEKEWWTNPYCPKWLWWIVAILPLKPEIRVLMLSTTSLLKRMSAVSRTLSFMLETGLNFYISSEND